MIKTKNSVGKPSIGSRILEVLQKFGYKLGANKALCALRDGFGVAGVPMMGMIIPVVIATLFFNNGTMLGNIPGIKDSAGMVWITKYIYPFLMATQQAATALFAMSFLVCTGFFMTKNCMKKGSPLTGTILTIACFIALAPFGIDFNKGVVTPWTDSEPFSTIGIGNLGPNGIMIALIIALTIPYLYSKLSNSRRLRIKLPDTIPPAIADVLTNVFSFTILITGCSLISWSWACIAHAANIEAYIFNQATFSTDKFCADNLFSALSDVIGKRFQSLTENPWFTGFMTFLMLSFWIFGIHGTNLFTPVVVVIAMPSAFINIYYWALYTNPAVQSILTHPTGTSVSDAYYHITSYINQSFFSILKDKDIMTIMYGSPDTASSFTQQFQDVINNMGDTSSKAFADAVTALITANQAPIAEYCAAHNIDFNAFFSGDGNPLTQLLTAYTYKSTLVDPDLGFLIMGSHYESIKLLTCAGIDSSGGSGATFGLTYAILLFSKFRPYREVAKLEAVPAIFGINEPIIFGLPIVLNFVIAIPFVLISTANSIFAHYMVKWHWVRPSLTITVAFTPMVFLTYMASGFDWRAPLWTIVFAIWGIGYYSLFLKISQTYTLKNTARKLGVDYKTYIEEHKEELYCVNPYKGLSKEEKIELRARLRSDKLALKESIRAEELEEKAKEKEARLVAKLEKDELKRIKKDES